jgi:hypothetical protein
VRAMIMGENYERNITLIPLRYFEIFEKHSRIRTPRRPSCCPANGSGVSAGNTVASRLRVMPPARLALRPSDSLAGSWKTQRPFAD